MRFNRTTTLFMLGCAVAYNAFSADKTSQAVLQDQPHMFTPLEPGEYQAKVNASQPNFHYDVDGPSYRVMSMKNGQPDPDHRQLGYFLTVPCYPGVVLYVDLTRASDSVLTVNWYWVKIREDGTQMDFLQLHSSQPEDEDTSGFTQSVAEQQFVIPDACTTLGTYKVTDTVVESYLWVRP